MSKVSLRFAAGYVGADTLTLAFGVLVVMNNSKGFPFTSFSRNPMMNSVPGTGYT